MNDNDEDEDPSEFIASEQKKDKDWIYSFQVMLIKLLVVLCALVWAMKNLVTFLGE